MLGERADDRRSDRCPTDEHLPIDVEHLAAHLGGRPQLDRRVRDGLEREVAEADGGQQAEERQPAGGERGDGLRRPERGAEHEDRAQPAAPPTGGHERTADRAYRVRDVEGAVKVRGPMELIGGDDGEDDGEIQAEGADDTDEENSDRGAWLTPQISEDATSQARSRAVGYGSGCPTTSR
jgi:hypothetical protein